jgi:hypothetical protein
VSFGEHDTIKVISSNFKRMISIVCHAINFVISALCVVAGILLFFSFNLLSMVNSCFTICIGIGLIVSDVKRITLIVNNFGFLTNINARAIFYVYISFSMWNLGLPAYIITWVSAGAFMVMGYLGFTYPGPILQSEAQ